MSITIYGASDDLIEIEGSIYAEINASEGVIALDHGWLVKIAYDGVWTIRLLAVGEGTYTLTPAVGEDDDNYSDRLTIDGPFIDWALFGPKHWRTL